MKLNELRSIQKQIIAKATREASYWFPEWGNWIDQLERRVCQRFAWKWGEKEPADYVREKRGQMPLPTITPMCSSCVLSAVHDHTDGGE